MTEMCQLHAYDCARSREARMRIALTAVVVAADALGAPLCTAYIGSCH